MKVIMWIAGFVAFGALMDAIETTDASERRFDLVVVLVAAAVLGGAALIERARHGPFAFSANSRRLLEVIGLYAVAIPAALYWVIATAFHLGSGGRAPLALVVGLGGFGLALWRWEQGG